MSPSAASSWEEPTLKEVIELLRAGKFAVPNFQRAFVWNGDLIKALMRSIFRDYYIGSLLLWEGAEGAEGAEDVASGTFDRLHCEPMYGFYGHENERSYHANRQWIILDGQQRLTAMHYAFFAPERGIERDEEFREQPVRFYVKIDKFTMSEGHALDDEEAFEVGIAVPESDQVDGHLFPLRLLSEDPTERSDWFHRYRGHWQGRQDRYDAELNELDKDAKEYDDEFYRILALRDEAENHITQSKKFQNHLDSVLDYRVRYVELKRDMEVGRVRDIFTQVNKRGEQLDDFGLLNAVVTLNGFSPKNEIDDLQRSTGLDSAKLETFIPRLMMLRAHPEHEIVLPVNEYLTPDRSVRVKERVDDGQNTRLVSRVLIEGDANGGSQGFKTRWDEAVGELTDGLTVLDASEQYGIPSAYDDCHAPLIFGPFNAMMPVFCALSRDATNSAVVQNVPAARAKVRQWYWACILTQRYGGTTEHDRQKANTDYREVMMWLAGGSKPSTVTDFLEAADPGLLDRAQHRSGIDGDDTRYRGLVSLMYSNAPRDLWSGNFERSASCEEHYIFPPKWCEAKGLESRDYETIFNRILISRDVADRCCDADGRSPMNFELLLDHWGNRGEGWEDEEKSAVLASHFITQDLLETLRRAPKKIDATDLQRFWHYRGREILATIGKHIFNEQRLSILSADRRWDRDIGKIERTLRSVLVDLIVADSASRRPTPMFDSFRTNIGLSDLSMLDNVEARDKFRRDLTNHLETAVSLSGLWTLIVDARIVNSWEQVKGLFPKGMDKGALETQKKMERPDFRVRMSDVTQLRNAIHHYRENRLDPNTRNTYQASVLHMLVCLGLRRSDNRAAGM